MNLFRPVLKTLVRQRIISNTLLKEPQIQLLLKNTWTSLPIRK